VVVWQFAAVHPVLTLAGLPLEHVEEEMQIKICKIFPEIPSSPMQCKMPVQFIRGHHHKM
jgi:hypothetical protein